MKSSLIILVVSCILGNKSYAAGLTEGQRYKVIKPIYIMGEYIDRQNKKISKDTARAYLHSVKLATRSFTAFQVEVPAGTIMTVISRVEKPWYLYFNSDYYFVILDPDPSQGLDIKLPLDKSFKGGLDGLNSEIFARP